jgi:N utilization substance protein A
MKTKFSLAFNEIAETRKLPKEVIFDALQAALVSAYRCAIGVSSAQKVEARIDEETGNLLIWVEQEVVEEVQNPHTEVSLEEARALYPDVQLGDMVMVENTPSDFGRIAAQTAKQVILQRMREAEREAQYQEYLERLGDLVTGTVQSVTGGTVTISLGRSEAILPRSQQVPRERYHTHDKVRAYVMEVRKTNRGPQIVVSRAHKGMLRRLLEYEVPEIYNGQVETKNIAREPGARSKVAVAALQEGIDPVGACVGMRGMRIQSIVRELNGEKIDVIEWNPDQAVFIAKALSPARVDGVYLDDDPGTGRTAVVVVPDDQLSLAIGREGQNARLAAKLTGWRIDIKSITEAARDNLGHVQTPELAHLREELADMIAATERVMEKKELNKLVMPEEYQILAQFVDRVERERLSLREAQREEARARREAARAQVPEGAYQIPLEDTDLSMRVFTPLDEAGYQTVGDVMEQLLLDPEVLLNLPRFGPVALEEVTEMASNVDVDAYLAEQARVAAEVEAEAAAAGDQVEAGPEGEQARQAEPEGETLEAAVPMAGAEVEAEAMLDEDKIEEARAARAALVAAQQAQPTEQAEPGQPQPAVVAEDVHKEEQAVPDLTLGDELDGGDEWEEEGEESEHLKRERDKHLRRQLVYDEKLGEVVAKRRRKPGRDREDWEDLID